MSDTYIDALNLTELSTFADTDQFVMFDSEEGKRAKYSDVKTAITKDVQTALTNNVTQLNTKITNEQTARQNADTAINADLAKKAYSDGEYADLHAGTANQLLADTYTSDDEPYHYRQTPSHAGTREMDEIVGGSVVWNQLVENGNFESANRWGGNNATISVASNKCTLTPNSTNSTTALRNAGLNGTAQHVLFCGMTVTTTKATACAFNIGGGSTANHPFSISANTRTFVTGILKVTTATGGSYFYCDRNAVLSTNDTCVYENVFVVDLTAMFPTTIADHIYNLEQATAGAGVEFFRKYFPDEYYAYDAGTIRSVEGLVSHDTVGFNQFDKNDAGVVDKYVITNTGSSVRNDTYFHSGYIPVLPNTAYYIGNNLRTSEMHCGAFYDADKNFISGITIASENDRVKTTPNNCHFMIINARIEYKDAVCINLSNTAKNGTYEPYEKHSYPLDSTVTLRGIPQLVDGQLKFDGDTYSADGVVTRRYGIVDLGSLTWNYESTNTRFAGTISDKNIVAATRAEQFVCDRYVSITDGRAISEVGDKCVYNAAGSKTIYIHDSAYTDANTFKTAMSGQYLVYELATPTTEQAEPYQELQICNPYGTEEYVSASIVPIGHYTKYPTDLKSIVEQIADAPSADGVYTLKASVSGGVVTYSWVK